MRVAVDAMGGDFAPREIVKGAVEAARQLPGLTGLILVLGGIGFALFQFGGDAFWRIKDGKLAGAELNKDIYSYAVTLQGMDGQVGSLKPGKLADLTNNIINVRLSHLFTVNVIDLVLETRFGYFTKVEDDLNQVINIRVLQQVLLNTLRQDFE